MKKILFAIVALIALATTATAQNFDANRKKALYDASSKFTVVDNKYAVMYYPVTYYDYYAVTGKKINGKKGINEVIVLSPNEQQRLAQEASALDRQVKLHVASSGELQTALQKKKNIQSEHGPYSTVTKGFYLAMDYQSYQRVQALRKQYLNSKKVVTKDTNTELIGTSNKEGDIFNIR